jgi:uncharacterized protein
MKYQRKLYPKLLEHAKKPQNTVLTGMRRTGKTTLVKQLLKDLPNKNALFLDLERIDNREIFLQKNYDAVLNSLVERGLSPNLPMTVALDEVQNAKQLPSVIKYLSDHYQIKFILTGSSSFYLKNLFTESLAGRKKIFELYPLDFGEYLNFKEVKTNRSTWQNKTISTSEYNYLTSYYEDFIKYGGFPQVTLATSEDDKKDFLSDILSSYINVDIKTMADFTDDRNIFNLIKLLASRAGSRLDTSKLASLLGLSRQTVNNYLDFLEKTYLIKTVPIYTHNTDREIVKAKKAYFADNGLMNFLINASSGAQFENALFNQLARQGEVQYYALKNGLEIDFVFDQKIALEAKEAPIINDLRQLKNLAKIAKIPKQALIGRHLNPSFSQYVWGGTIT